MVKLRKATPGDVEAILGLIKELAAYERAPEQVVNTVPELTKDLFELKCCSAIVAELDNTIVGFALYYTSYSTWKGKCMYLEDLYVKPDLRAHGIGQQLFTEVVEVAKQSGVKRMDWQVLEWNEPALKFYAKNNAILDHEWVNGRLFF